VDIFAGCLDQVGLLEMKGLSNSTGGHMILTDSFTSSMYKQSFARVFNKDAEDNLLMAFNASLDVLTTKELKVTGLIGHAVSLNKKSASVGETECGIGNTSAWKMCGIDPEASYGIYFEVASQGGGPSNLQPGQNKGMMQFLTKYQHADGQMHLRGMPFTKVDNAGSNIVQLLRSLETSVDRLGTPRLLSHSTKKQQQSSCPG
jgi:protein transport protein SEC23